MKRFFKTAVNFIAVAIITLSVFGFSACEDIKKLELDLKIYNFTDSKFYDAEDVKFTVELYRHLADETVDAVLDNVKKDYYKDAIFYKEDGYGSQIMLGDLKMVDGKIEQNLIGDKLPALIGRGEFEYGGTTGSNLVNEKGSIGLWRSWYASNEDGYKGSNGMDSGRATWFIPTTSISGYNGYFCVFAKFDTENEANAKAISALTDIFASSDNYDVYAIFWTGEYSAASADKNYGLTFHAVKDIETDEKYNKKDGTYDGTTIFEAEENQLVYYNMRTVYVPKTVDGEVSAKVNSIKIK